MTKNLCLLCLFLLSALAKLGAAVGDAPVVSFLPAAGSFVLAADKAAAPILVDESDWAGVKRAAADLQADVERVTGARPLLLDKAGDQRIPMVLVGTLGRSVVIDSLVKQGRLNVSAIEGRWEAFALQVVDKPLPGVDQALVIVGSDKRGTIYGIYEISQEIGVSPWAWWADVPVRHRDALYVQSSGRIETGPTVKYRGIFLNDEAPALAGWAKEKFGGMNSKCYAKIFELILRLRGNYLWPAMWDNAFNEDDPENPRLADEYGVVMGNSHHEPMLRAQQEWKRHGTGPWNYHTNGDVLRKFWADGVHRNRNFESIVSIGMRGDGDEPMSEEANIALLQQIVADQRAILTRETGKKIEEIPQLWALYKEVQEYYERGMRVPDDVTLLWCDDNWGNIRRLPTLAERKRSGGAGVYYHFDYVGGPRNYKWLNTCPISKTWEQMNLAWQYGADRIWIVNVGDLKPMEFPIEFFLNMAWAPARWTNENLQDFERQWAAREFGAEHATEVADLIATYTKYNSRRKPEMLSPDTFSLVNYGEAERIVAEWNALATRAEALEKQLPAEYRDAYFQLVLWPIKACAIVNEMFVASGRNRLYANQGRASANDEADTVARLFRADEALTRRYNEELSQGKWRHFADQAHIGYTYWQQPDRNVMPALFRLDLPDEGIIGVAPEGSPKAVPGNDTTRDRAVLPPLESFGAHTRWIEVFNRGKTAFGIQVETSVPWLKVSPSAGEVLKDQRLLVSVDWEKVPAGEHRASVIIKPKGSWQRIEVAVPVRKSMQNPPAGFKGFVETEGGVAMEAEHWSRAVSGDLKWKVIPGFGRTLSGVTFFPVEAPSRLPSATSPHLEYDVFLQSSGEATLQLVTAPTLAFVPGRGLRCAVSIDDQPPVVVDLLEDRSLQAWEQAVGDGARLTCVAKLPIARPGLHTVKFWPVDPAVVLERLVLDLGGVRPSYLGLPESPRL